MAKQATKPELASEDEEVSSILDYSINIEEAERPPVLPVGEYRATITGVEKKFGKDSGRPYLNIKFSVDSDDQPADFVEQLGTNSPLSVFYMLFGAEDTPQSRYNMKQFCKAIGAPMSNRIDVRGFMDMEAKVSVEHQPDLEGNPQPRVRRVHNA